MTSPATTFRSAAAAMSERQPRSRERPPFPAWPRARSRLTARRRDRREQSPRVVVAAVLGLVLGLVLVLARAGKAPAVTAARPVAAKALVVKVPAARPRKAARAMAATAAAPIPV